MRRFSNCNRHQFILQLVTVAFITSTFSLMSMLVFQNGNDFQVQNMVRGGDGGFTTTRDDEVSFSAFLPASSSPTSNSDDDFEDVNSLLFDLTDFRYTINEPGCDADGRSNNVDLLIAIHSSVSNTEHRTVVRETWGSRAQLQKAQARLLFFVGSVANPALQSELIAENKLYGDIVQGSFLDSYRNLTYKHAMVLKWVTQFCQNAKYILKADDDVYVSLPRLRNRLALTSPSSSEIWCLVYDSAAVKRSHRSKWRVTFKEFSSSQYPRYCAGFAVLYTRETARRLNAVVQAARKYFWVDDVLMTGIYTKIANITLNSFKKTDYLPAQEVHDFLEVSQTPNGTRAWFYSRFYSPVEVTFALTESDPEQVRQMWRLENHRSGS